MTDPSPILDESHPNRDTTTAKEGHPVAAAPDPFDPARLRLSQDFAANVGVKKALLTVPCRKPAKEWFVRVHPDENYRLQTAVVELKEERETYLVDPDLWNDMAAESTFSPRAFVLYATRQGECYFWPIRLPDEAGKLDPYNKSAMEAACDSGRWMRIAANRQRGEYDQLVTDANWPAPVWPEKTLPELLRIAFNDRLIDTYDHPVLKQLRGES